MIRDPFNTRIALIQNIVIKLNLVNMSLFTSLIETEREFFLFYFTKMIAVLFGLIYLNQQLDQSGIQNINGK